MKGFSFFPCLPICLLVLVVSMRAEAALRAGYELQIESPIQDIAHQSVHKRALTLPQSDAEPISSVTIGRSINFRHQKDGLHQTSARSLAENLDSPPRSLSRSLKLHGKRAKSRARAFLKQNHKDRSEARALRSKRANAEESAASNGEESAGSVQNQHQPETPQAPSDPLEGLVDKAKSFVDNKKDPSAQLSASTAGKDKRLKPSSYGPGRKKAISVEVETPYGLSPFLDAPNSSGPHEEVDRLAEITDKLLGATKKKAIVYGSGAGTSFVDEETGLLAGALPQEATALQGMASDTDTDTRPRASGQDNSFEQLVRVISEAGFKGLDQLLQPVSKAAGSAIDKGIERVAGEPSEAESSNSDASDGDKASAPTSSRQLADLAASLAEKVQAAEERIQAKIKEIEELENKNENGGSDESVKANPTTAAPQKPVANSNPLYQSPEVGDLPPMCQRKLYDLRDLIVRMLILVEKLAARVRSYREISYMTSEVLTAKLISIKIAGDEALLAANLGDLPGLNSSVRDAGLELTRVAFNQVISKLEPKLKFFVLKLRTAYKAYRKVCQ